MRQQSRWKRRLAVVLAAVMTLSTGMTAMAAVGWQKEEGGWRHYKEDGTPDKDKMKPIHGQWYAFDKDGYMEENTWVVREVEEDGVKKVYHYVALPSGELANGQWVHLSERGERCTHTGECGCSWYFFNPIEPGEGIGESHARRPKGGERISGPIQNIKGQWYAFDEGDKMLKKGFHDIRVDDKDCRIYAYQDGHLATKGWKVIDGKWYRFAAEEDTMWGRAQTDTEWKDGKGNLYAFGQDSAMISRNWWSSGDNRNLEGYYQYQGEKAVNKWLPIGNFWYQFDAAGKVVAYAPTATGSNAGSERPAAHIPSIGTAKATPNDAVHDGVVKTITAEKKEFEVEVSKDENNTNTVELNFKVDRATGSNAEKDDMADITENHDIWLDGIEYGGKYSVKSDGDGGCVVEYWNLNASNVDKTETVRLMIDGEASNLVSIKLVATSIPGGTEGEEKTEQIKDILSGSYEEGKEEEAVTALKEAYKTAKDDQSGDATSGLHQELLEMVKENPTENNLVKLEEAYVKANKIQQNSPSVSDKAGDLFGKGEEVDRKVEVVGGALNAKANDTVQLVVDVPQKEVEEFEDTENTENTYKPVASFDIELRINGTKKSDLELPVVISMPIPEGVEEGMLLFNIHGANKRIEVPFTIEDGRLYFVTDKFSTYVFVKSEKKEPVPGGDDDDNNGGGSSSSRRTSNGSGASAGQWIQDATGWWFRFTNGSYPASSWQYLPYNGTSRWYHFNAAGYMDSGWFTDVDGQTYYLNPVSDGTKGAMLVGWQQIDGQWYYFNPSVGGPQGSMLKSTTTPDGYQVNEKGQWIQ